MPSFRTATVTAVNAERPGLQKVDVDGEPAYVLTDLIGTVAEGDRVVVNTTAVELGLGTGGWHFVHWNLSRQSWHRDGSGHVLKLRYTSLQADTGVAEESHPDLPRHLGGIPVVVCDLHSQVPIVAASFALAEPTGSSRPKLAYVMTDSAALPMVLSDVVHGLRHNGLLSATITCGQAFGGDYEAVNVASALQAAVGVVQARAVVVAPGPGVAGTGSALGFSGMEGASVIDTCAALGATAVVAVRYSEADGRARHRGVSHHTVAVLETRRSPVLVAVPEPAPSSVEAAKPEEVRPVEVPEVDLVLDRIGFDVTTMGRTLNDDPEFVRWAAAAGVLARQMCASG